MTIGILNRGTMISHGLRQCVILGDPDVLVRKYTNRSSNIIVPKYEYRTHKDYATNY